jgi:hypothetical protein
VKHGITNVSDQYAFLKNQISSEPIFVINVI